MTGRGVAPGPFGPWARTGIARIVCWSALPTDGIDTAGLTLVSFREVDANGVPTSPARYFVATGTGNGAPVVLQTVPTDPAEAQSFRQRATFSQTAPNSPGAGQYSLESLVNAGSFVRHSNYLLRVDANEGSGLYDADSTFAG